MDPLIVGLAVILVCIVVFAWPQTRIKHQDDRPGRTLDVFESTMYHIGAQGMLFVGTAAFFATREKVTEDEVKAALRMIGKRHPLCRIRIVEEDGALFFREMDEDTIDFTVSQSTDWLAEFDSQLQKPLDTQKGPLWRATFLPCVTDHTTPSHPNSICLLFNFHHAIADATSGGIVINNLLDDLEDIHSGESPKVIVRPIPPSALETLSFLHPSALDLLKFAPVCLALKIPGLRSLVMSMLAGEQIRNPWITKRGEVSDRDPNCEKKTSIIPMVLDSEETSKFLKRCKTEKCKVLAAIRVAAMGAMSDILGYEEKAKWAASMTVDLRRLFPKHLEMDAVAAYVGGLETTHSLPADWKKKFWQCAREVSASVHGNLVESVAKNVNTYFSFRAFGVDLYNMGQGSNNGSRTHCFMALNNVGNSVHLNRPEENNIQLSATFGGATEHCYGTTMACNAMTVQGRLCLTIVYYTNVMSKEDAKSLARGIVDAIQRASRQ
jgi:hypothetical protein